MRPYAVIIVAAGKSSRFGGQLTGLEQSILKKKPVTLLKGRAVWLHCAHLFSARPEVRQIILVVSSEDRDEVMRRYAADLSLLGVEVVTGGKQRSDSVQAGLKKLRAEIEYVAIHDASRPCLTGALIESVFSAAIQHRAAIAATPIIGTVKTGVAIADSTLSELERIQLQFGGNATAKKTRYVIGETVPRDRLWEAQTPQAFSKELIVRAYENYNQTIPTPQVTDDASLVERLGEPVALVPGDPLNIKITNSLDLIIAEKFLEIGSKKKKNSFDAFFSGD